MKRTPFSFILAWLFAVSAALGQVVIPWNDVDKTGSSLANLATRSASDLSSGTLPAARLPAFAGDATSTAGNSTLTLANTGVAAGIYGSATAAPAITIDAKGRITSAANTTITPAWGSITGRPTIATTAPLTGGGALTGNLTLAINSATTAAPGAVQLATADETRTGTDAAKAVTSAALAAINPRGPPDYIWSDGTTSGRAIVQTPGARGNIAGASVASWVGWVEVPSIIPANNTCFMASIGSSPTTGNGTANSLNIGIGSGNGTLSILQSGTVGFSDRRTFDWPGFWTAYNSQRIWLEVRFFFGTTNPVVRINGNDESSKFFPATATSGAGVPNWLDAAMVCTNAVTGSAWVTGSVPLGAWLNTHLTNAESESWRLNGRPPAWVVQGGSQVSGVSSSRSYSLGAADANNTTDTTNSATTVTAVAGARTGGSGAFFLRIAQNATSAGRAGGISNVLGIAQPSRVSVRFWARTTTGITGPGINVYIERPFGGGVVGTAQTIAPTATWTAYNLTFDVNGAGASWLSFAWSGAGGNIGDSIDIDDVEVNPVGALSLPGIQPILVVDDVTMIGGNTGRLVGMNPITARKDWRLVARTSTNGWEQILGGALFAEPERHRIDSWVINNIGGTSRTVSLSHTNSGSTYASGLTAAAGRLDVAPTTRFPGTGQTGFWVNSNGTDALIHTIRGQRLGNN